MADPVNVPQIPKVRRDASCQECEASFSILLPANASGIDYCVCPDCSVMLELNYDQPEDHPIKGTRAEPGF